MTEINRPLMVRDVIRLNGADETYTVSKIRNYAKGRRISLVSQYGYGCHIWEAGINYQLVDHDAAAGKEV
uniref:Uncharacterized protein n=1 Tax=viral metagenome TaxID=1070528 RepID=A0A6M3KI72_9ZZZZ